MKVILAQPRGFCAGVVRAIEIVERALQRYGAPVYVHHEIVHNRHVVDDLRSKGAIFVDDLADVPEGAHAIFSAHGVGRSVEALAERRSLQVLDATCPLVTKVHNQGQRYAQEGRTVVLIGHAGHPEVVGTLDQIPGPVVLVQDVGEAETLDFPADAPLAYVSQTTLSVDDTRRIIDVLRRRFINLSGPSKGDICYATQNRQSAVRELAGQVEVMLVVGSPNSSNSRRLQEIAEELGVPSYLLADGGELRQAWVADARIVGLTAGASAPEASVDDVLRALRQLAPVELVTMDGRRERAVFPLPVVLEAVS
ncbi:MULTISPECIES: 4-hydroxy-3-methylbut-2-enyl diphosphate reductase [unclassified Dyella]|uniref:4-hydroxy-3-methylbut-2-enyl diphosphate reductase n=1 Tax=unclassified Dyella TaxID=2634549 RepID=UPI000C823FDF|nr:MULTISPECIES: 4-hydroxy-3-methylbut-2-enyl diphosphate reductase [unclassified Dyella]MDR3443853.1 4-hydroxy-3-methylbut-2-enyl diphosphate reductase [Dyella sp.]PMQ03100.1 4-hydroxy-3-methylbut-2-enyl diphosphate reductase [Dyella sp. AD56]